MQTQLTKCVISGLVVVLLGACGDDGGSSDDATPGTSGGSGSTTDLPGEESSDSTAGPSTVSADGTDSTGPGPSDESSSGTTGPVGPSWECEAAPVGGATPLIDDFELPEGVEEQDNALPENEGRTGFWFVYNDGTAGGMQTPPADAVFPTDETPAAGLYSLEMTGSGFTEFGAGVGATLNATGGTTGGACPFNASAYEGITFWAKGEGTVRVNFPIPATVPPSDGGTCAEMCYDNYGTDIDLTADWTEYTVLFSDLSQQGFGAAVDFNAAELLQLQWQDPTGDVVEIWLDNVAFTADGGGGSSSGDGSSGSSDGGGSDSGSSTGE
jgi:hypothetical protein